MSKAKSRGFVGKIKWSVIFLAVFLLHFLLVQNKFLSWSEIFDGRMIMNFDYGLHYYDVIKGVEFLNENGDLNGYDEAFFGGYEKGIVDDLSSKGWIIFTWVFSFLGIGAAYKLFIYLSLLAMPVLFALALRTVEVRREIILLGFVLAILYQNTAKIGNFLWVGMITFPLAIYFSMLGVVVLKRFFYDIDKSEAHRHIVLFTLLAALTFYVHILGVILLVVPAVILYLLHFKQLKPEHQTGFWLATVTVFLASSLWLWPFLTKSYLALNELKAHFFQTPGWQQSLQDTFYLWLPGDLHPLNLRVLIIVTTLIALIYFFRANKRSFWFSVLVLGFFIVLTHIPIPLLKSIQPYRFQVVVYLWGLAISLMALNRSLQNCTDKQLKLRLLVAHVVTGIVVAVLALSFFVVPFRNAISNYRILYTDVPPALASTIDYFKDKKVEGRILFEVEHSADAVLFQLKTGYKMIGGPYRYAFWGHAEANFTEEAIFGQPIEKVTDAKWQEMIKKYELQYVVCYSNKSCAVLEEKAAIWEKVCDLDERKIFQSKTK